jgi:GPH family glycoside/pentoside/hexuronide:cation symporter
MATKEELAEEWGIASTKKMYSYGFGYLIINYFLVAGLAVLYYYYTIELGLPFFLAGLAMTIFAIWNMFNDPLLGYLTDRPMKWSRRWGFRAPWVVISAIPFLIFYFLIWIPPVRGGVWVLFFWLLITTFFFDSCFSIYNDHVYGGFTNQFPTEYERRKGFAIIVVIAAFGVIFIRLIPDTIITYGRPETFIFSALVVTIILLSLNIFVFLGIKESKELKEMLIRGFETTEKRGFFNVMKTALKRKNFVISLIGYTAVVTAQTFMYMSDIFYMRDVLQMPYSPWMALVSLAGLAGVILSIPFWYNYAKKHGFKRTYYVGLLFAGLLYLPLLFIPSGQIGLGLWILFRFLGGIPYGGYTVMLMPVASDTCDEVSIHLGRRQDGTLQGIRTFFFRIAYIVQGLVFTLVFIFTAYNPNAEFGTSQPAAAIWGVRILAGLIPALIMIVMCFIFYKFYELEGESKKQIMKKVKEMGLIR